MTSSAPHALTAVPAPPQRHETLDGLRGVAALAVMAHHLTQHLAGHHLFAGASVAVDLFFCLSGFVLAESNLRRLLRDASLGDFLRRRWLRLYPLHLVGWGLGAVALLLKITHGQTGMDLPQALMAIGLHALYLPWLGTGSTTLWQDTLPLAAFPVNDPAWSLCFEAAANIVFALLLMQLCRRTDGRSSAPHTPSLRAWPLLGLALLGGLALTAWTAGTHIAAPGWGHGNFAGGWARVCWGFFSGVAVWLLWQRVRDRLPRLQAGWLLAASLALYLQEVRPSVWLLQALVGVPLLVLLAAAAQGAHPRLARLQRGLGWLSYPLYCVHVPVLMLASVTAGHRPLSLSEVLGCAVLSIVLAIGAGRWIDAPLRARWQRSVVAPASTAALQPR